MNPSQARQPPGPAVIVDPYSSGNLYAPLLRETGVPTVAVTSRPDIPPAYAASFHPEDFPEVVSYDGDLAPVVRRLAELRPRCVLAGADPGVELADRLAAELCPDRANDPAKALARRDKGEMAAAAAAAGIPVMAHLSTSDAGEVADWITRAGLAGRDLVVKPPRSAATDGVTRVPGGAGWRGPFLAQLGQLNQWGGRNEQMLVQEYAAGTEYAVDVFTADGVHSVTDVCRYRKIDNDDQMAVYDTVDWLPPDDAAVDELVDYTRRVLDAVGLRFGAAHVELMRTADGPRLIEVNARPHGGGHPRFSLAATGDSQVHRAVRYLAAAEPLPTGYRLLQHASMVFLIGRVAGVVRNAEVLDEVRTLPSCHEVAVQVRTGDQVRPTRDLLGSLALGFVVLVHPDADRVAADRAAVREIESRLRIEPDPSA